MYANFSTCRKYRSAAEHKDQVERERLDQAAASNYALASSNPGIASPLAAIPKDDGDVRLTHDAKRSVGTAIPKDDGDVRLTHDAKRSVGTAMNDH